MLVQDADPTSVSTASRGADLVVQAKLLIDVDFDQEPSTADEQVERKALSGLCDTLDEFQEQSYLLDPSLEAFVSPLLVTLRNHVRRPGCHLASKRMARLARLIYFVTKVRGAKTIVRFFPHEVTDLSLLVSLLSPSSSASTSSAPDLMAVPWELRYALLLWLSVCIRLPFSLSLLAPGTSDAVEELTMHWLDRSGREGEGAQEVLGRYFARNDTDLTRLIARCEAALKDDRQQLFAFSLVSALLLVLSAAPPSHILPHFERLYALLALLPSPSDGRAGVGAAKARAKFAGRIALLRLQAARDGGENDVPEEAEVIVGELIEGLAQSDSIPRYSSAKYLARLALVLPASFATQVLDAVLGTFEEALSPAERESGGGEGRAQGACLAVGEMARRGVLNRLGDRPSCVSRVVDCTLQALAYDHLTALHPIGSTVRDSASYVLWSLSRTLPASLLSERQAQELAECLLCTACFDKEVSVRRAASAAWQEAVGRWGIFPHGIAILRQVDFFTVSVRHRAFLDAAVSIASYAPYRPAMVAHLVGRKGGTGVAHYDSEIRALAAQALGNIVAEAAVADESLAGTLIREQISKLSRIMDTGRLQGVLLSLAALADAAGKRPVAERDELRREILNAVCTLYPSTRMLSRNHLVLSSALCALAKSAPSAPTILPGEGSPHTWADIIRLACDRSEESVHAAAGDALQAISRAVDCSAEIDRLVHDLDSHSSTRQQVAACLLGRASYDSPKPHSDRAQTVVKRLVRFVQREGPDCARSIEARRDGVDALASLLVARSEALEAADEQIVPAAFEVLLAGFSDYTTDQRGDVGSWVRMSTIAAFSTLFCAGIVREQNVMDRAVAQMAKQAVERLDGVREAAGKGLMAMWDARNQPGRAIMRASEVWKGIASEERWNWRDLSWASGRILPLLQVSQYCDAVLEGAVLASTSFSSSTPFLDYALLLPPLPEAGEPDSYSLLTLLRSMYTLGKANLASNRLFVPFVSVIASFAEAGILDEIAADESARPESVSGPKFLRNILALACSGVARIKNNTRLVATAKLTIAFLALPKPVSSVAAPRLVAFLAHAQPWLRQQSADELFGALSAQGLIEGGEELEQLLTETDWASDNAQPAASRVAQRVGALVEDV